MQIRGEKHRKLCQRWDVPYGVHYLTFSCYRRQPFFGSERTCRWFLECLDQARARQGFHLWAWVIMPEHVHALISIPNEAQISAILRSIKYPLARRAILWAKENRPDRMGSMEVIGPDGIVSYRFWQRGGGYDRNMRSTRDVHEKIRYIHNNPVRRELVRRPEDWPWSSWRANQTREDIPLRIDRETIPILVE
ncbi:MAG: transposase [Planctomycetaceae bacterium]|nr:transposase [Planctomycetaceae bacterium]